MKFLAVDLGASSGRTIVAELSKESITLTETHRFKNSMKDINGEKHWDVHALLEEIKIGIAASGEVEGIGIDTWGVDFGECPLGIPFEQTKHSLHCECAWNVGRLVADTKCVPEIHV